MESVFAQARLAWPELNVEFETFREHCERHELAVDDTSWHGHASDLLLALACSLGDERALEAFENQLVPVAARAIARVDAHAAFVDEGLQVLRDRLLVGVDAKIREYAARGPLVSWLRVSATRVALDAVRARNGQRSRLAELPERLAREEMNPLSDIVRSRYAEAFEEAVKHAISQLPNRQRTLLRLHLVGGCSIDRLGSMYGVHRATAARWLQRARQNVFDQVRERLTRTHQLTDTEFHSIARGVQSGLDLSLSACFNSSPSQ